MAVLLGIAIKPHSGAEMLISDQVMLSPEAGVAGDSRGKPGPRQVTLMSLTAWNQACHELGIELDWIKRRANLLVDDLPLYQSKGNLILLGEALLEITGETDPCARMEKVHQGLFDALAKNWRGGVTCRVLKAGQLATGMDIEMHKKSESK